MKPGSRIGVYEVSTPLGAGGMGEVYLATDTRLNRQVALKLLPAALASDPERSARFKREAQLLASLNHPNVAAIYGFEESTATPGQPPLRALVMELVEGPTLAERLSDGPLPLEEAIGIARQIAEAIEYAHEQGVIHRDLKPANIKMTPGGAVKVLDFGLAKALDQGSTTPSRTGPDPAASPTLSLAATQAGFILGTAAYMSPEQAKGKAVDRRSDIWSFGIVLFEMLTARSAYSGETVSETMAHVITKEPDWLALPATTPAPLSELVRRCLVKDPRNRLQAIGEARIALDHLQRDPHAPRTGSGAADGAPAAARGSRRELFWAALALIGVVAATWLAVRDRLAPAPRLERLRFELDTASRGGLEYPQGAAVISPDGRKIAYAALVTGKGVRLWVHSFETGTAEPIDSTEGIGPSILVWSPDSRQLAFSAPGQRRLKRVSATGGPAQMIAELPDTSIAAAWGPDDVIVLGGRGLKRVRASSAEVSDIPMPEDARSELVRFPSFLPDGKHFFYLSTKNRGDTPIAYVGALDSAERRPLPGITSELKYSPSGHVLFVRNGALMAQTFDAERLELSGEPFVVVDQLTATGAVAGPYSVSDTGTLVYRIAGGRADSQLTWFDRTGKLLGAAGPVGQYGDLELSLNDRFVAYEYAQPGAAVAALERVGDIWTLDLETGVRSRLTSDPAREADPVWSPDSKHVAFRSDRAGSHMYRHAVGVVAEDELIFKGAATESPDHWSPDGRYIIFVTSGENDIWALPMNGVRPMDGAQPLAVATTKFREGEGRVSPDGRWIAYQSNESGRDEIYVQSFPKPVSRQQVSSGGGTTPRWSRDGKELYFLGERTAASATVMSVALRPQADSLTFRSPSRLFVATTVEADLDTGFAVAADGRFLINVPTGERATPPITVILNWSAELQR